MKIYYERENRNIQFLKNYMKKYDIWKNRK